MRGAALGTDGLGKPILAMPSTTNKGESKIVPFLKEGSLVFITIEWLHFLKLFIIRCHQFCLDSFNSYVIIIDYFLVMLECFMHGYTKFDGVYTSTLSDVVLQSTNALLLCCLRLHGCSVARLHGCSVARLHGCSVARLHGCSVAGAGVVTTRAHVHYIVTEFGIAYLFGKNLRQRAYELIRISHPAHREMLEKASFERLKVMPSP